MTSGCLSRCERPEKAQACDYLGPLRSALKAEGLEVTADVSTARGRVANAIVEFANNVNGDLIAMSPHERNSAEVGWEYHNECNNE